MSRDNGGFYQSKRRVFEDGYIVAVNSNGSYDVSVSGRAFPYTRIRASIVGNPTNFQHGEKVRIGFINGNPLLPFIFGRSSPRGTPVPPGTVEDVVNFDGLWLQAEGLPELAQSNFRPFTNFIWGPFSTPIGDFIVDEPISLSHSMQGHVYWTDYEANYFAFAYWKTVLGTPTLMLKIGVIDGDATDYPIKAYTIPENFGLISQGGSVYYGGREPGGLGLHFLPELGKLVLLGPLTHITGRFECFVFDVTMRGFVNNTISKIHINTSFGGKDCLIGWWGGNSSPSYYTEPNIYLKQIGSRNTLVDKFTINRSALTLGDNYYGCHPFDTSRAMGRWPRKLSNISVEHPVEEGIWAVWALSGAYGSITAGSGSNLESFGGSYPDNDVVSILQTQQADLNFINAESGNVDRIYTSLVASDSDVDIDSLIWFDLNDPELTGIPFGHIGDFKGWAFIEGCTRRYELVGSPPDAYFKITRGNFPYSQDVPHLLHPLKDRNHMDRTYAPTINTDEAVGNGVFEWRPDSFNHYPMSVFSKKKHHLSVYSVPHLQNYGSKDGDSVVFSYENPAYAAWVILEAEYNIAYDAWEAGGSIGDPPVAPIGDPPRLDGGPPDYEENGSREPKSYIDEYWRLMHQRWTFKTYFKHLDETGAEICTKQINQTFTGLRDGPLYPAPAFTHVYRNYGAKDVLDMVWQYDILDTQDLEVFTSAADRFCLALLMDMREQDTDGPSEAKPFLNLYEYGTGGNLVLSIDLLPGDRFTPGGQTWDTYNFVTRPIMKHYVNDAGFTSIDVFVQWRPRASAYDTTGVISSVAYNYLRVVTVRWDADNLTLAAPVITTVDILGRTWSEREIEGFAYVDGKVFVQFGNKLAHFVSE